MNIKRKRKLAIDWDAQLSKLRKLLNEAKGLVQGIKKSVDDIKGVDFGKVVDIEKIIKRDLGKQISDFSEVAFDFYDNFEDVDSELDDLFMEDDIEEKEHDRIGDALYSIEEEFSGLQDEVEDAFSVIYKEIERLKSDMNKFFEGVSEYVVDLENMV